MKSEYLIPSILLPLLMSFQCRRAEERAVQEIPENKGRAVLHLFEGLLEGMGPELFHEEKKILKGMETGPVWQGEGRHIFFTLYEGGRGVRLQGEGEGIFEAVLDAVKRGEGEARDLFSEGGIDGVNIQVDIPWAFDELKGVEPGYLLARIEPGIHGILLRRGRELCGFLPSDPITRGWFTPRKKGMKKKMEILRTVLERECTPAGLEGARFRMVKTVSFLGKGGGSTFHPLFRGNLLLEEAPGSSAIHRSIIQGAEWLVRNLRDDGRFNYQYHPNLDRYPRSYNEVRHAGTTFSLFYLHNLTGDSRYLNAGRLALTYILGNLVRLGESGMVGMAERGGTTSSGSTALSLLTLLEMDRSERGGVESRVMRGLANLLFRMVDSRGAVFRNYEEALASDRVEKEPVYYPGEVLLALSKYHIETGDPTSLDIAVRIAKRQMQRFGRFHGPDHWVIQGLALLNLITGREEYLKMALKMAKRFIRTQFTPEDAPFPDYVGAYRRRDDVPRTTRAGSRSEALTSVVMGGWMRGLDVEELEDSLLYAAKHIIEQQFNDVNSFFLPDPSRAIGGFRAGPLDNHLRIDFSQHNLVALSGAYLVAKRREGVPLKELPYPFSYFRGHSDPSRKDCISGTVGLK